MKTIGSTGTHIWGVLERGCSNNVALQVCTIELPLEEQSTTQALHPDEVTGACYYIFFLTYSGGRVADNSTLKELLNEARFR